MTKGLPHIERTGGGDWHVDITTLPVRVRDGDSAQVASIVSIRHLHDGSFLWSKLLAGIGLGNEVVPQILAKIRELLDLHEHPSRILIANRSAFGGLADQLNALIGKLQLPLPIRVVLKEAWKPRSTGRIEASVGKMNRQLEVLPGYVDWRRGGSARSDVDKLLTLAELESRVRDYITN